MSGWWFSCSASEATAVTKAMAPANVSKRKVRSSAPSTSAHPSGTGSVMRAVCSGDGGRCDHARRDPEGAAVRRGALRGGVPAGGSRRGAGTAAAARPAAGGGAGGVGDGARGGVLPVAGRARGGGGAAAVEDGARQRRRAAGPGLGAGDCARAVPRLGVGPAGGRGTL